MSGRERPTTSEPSRCCQREGESLAQVESRLVLRAPCAAAEPGRNRERGGNLGRNDD